MKATQLTSETEFNPNHNQPINEPQESEMSTMKDLNLMLEVPPLTSSPFITGRFAGSDIRPPRSPLTPQRQALLTPKQCALQAFRDHWAPIEYNVRQKIAEALKGVENGLPHSYKIYHEAQKESEDLGNRCKSEQDALQASLGICLNDFKAKGEEIQYPIFIKDENTESAPNISGIIFCKCKRISCKTNQCPCRKAGQHCGASCRLGKRHQCANKPSQPVKKEKIAAEVEATKKRLREELDLTMGPNKKVRAWMIEGA